MGEQEHLVKKDDFSLNEQNPSVSFPVVNSLDGKQIKKLKHDFNSVFRKEKVDETTLNEWLQSSYDHEQLQELFVNMDLAMKYIHEQGYYVSSFALDKISLLNQSIRQIRFRDLTPLPKDFLAQKNVVRDNIFMASILHVGLYAKCLQYFTMETIPTIKENFSQFSIFLPPEDVAYYSGIIERGASVYYSAFVGERKKRDLQNLENEVSSNGSQTRGKSLVKSNGTNYTAADFIPDNEETNEIIYSNLTKKEGAFARSFIYPILIFVLGFVVLFLSYLFR